MKKVMKIRSDFSKRIKVKYPSVQKLKSYNLSFKFHQEVQIFNVPSYYAAKTLPIVHLLHYGLLDPYFFQAASISHSGFLWVSGSPGVPTELCFEGSGCNHEVLGVLESKNLNAWPNLGLVVFAANIGTRWLLITLFY